MNKLIIGFVGVLMMGLVLAAPNNVTDLILEDFVAGGTSIATFSFDYLESEENLPEGSLVLRVNMSSIDSDYPVWKGDFSMGGIVEQFASWNNWGRDKVTPLQCLEEEEIEFLNGNGPIYTHKDGAAGIFYCYDPSNYLDVLDLNRRDDVTLEISSHQALYPGGYRMSVELMELERDASPPVMDLVLDGFIFGENDTIPIRLNVSDMYNVMSVEYEIMNPELENFYASGWIGLEIDEVSGLYEDDFNMTQYGLNESGSYWIKARACDVLGNCGEL